MTKTKYLLMLILIGLILLLLPNIVNATDTFTTNDGIIVKKVVDKFTNGSILLNISNINLDLDGSYQFGISETNSKDEVSGWFSLGNINVAQKTAKINLTVEENAILSVLRKTDTAYLFVKDTNDTMIIDGLKLDLTLPPLYAFDYTTWLNNYYITGALDPIVDQWGGATYNIKNAYYKFEKITDETLVEQYKQAMLDGTSLSDVFSIDVNTIKNKDNWNFCTRDHSYPFTKIDNSNWPKDQGAYYLYVKAKDTDSKTLYGCLIINVDSDGPKVKEISVSSPASGTYKTGQTVKIRVYFTETIKGTKMPILKIKFGDSSERSISTGTLVNTGNESQSYGSHYIEYSYNIQESDIGQLATVSLSGGDIQDTSNNDAVLSCPVITGSTIKANVAGEINNNTGNQNNSNNNNNNNNNNNKNNNNSTITKDNTTAPGKLPQTGISIGISLSILISICISVFAYLKYKKWKIV